MSASNPSIVNAAHVTERCTLCGHFGPLQKSVKAIREGYECASCRASLRYRAQAAAILSEFADVGASTFHDLCKSVYWQRMDVYEPGIIGPFRRYQEGLPLYKQSFYWSDVEPGQSRNGVICQDLMKLTFGSAEFDIVITSDILEHIRRPYAAFAEIRRVLREGGCHIFSVPAQDPLRSHTLSRVDTSGEQDIYLMDQVYHGSGDGGRSLVYTEFGKDLLDALRTYGFESTILAYSSPGNMLRDVYTFISVAV